MKLQIHSIHFDAAEHLTDFIQQKVDKLETFFDAIIDGEVFLRLDKGEHARQNKMVEIKLNIPGQTLFAKEIDVSFEAATDEAVESLRRQLRKHKSKLQSH
ncbi:MAG: ribosome hibernation-promoting factor, HPF/YfiA family [Bernardetiaceae bacterium]